MVLPHSGLGQAVLRSCGDIFVINLASRPDRLAEFDAQLARIGLGLGHPQVHRFDAVRPADPGQFESIGARGCFASHLGVLRQALGANAPMILICEDDLDFAPDVAARLAGLMAGLDAQPWDIFYGFGPQGHTAAGAGLAEIPADTAIRCTHMLALRHATIKALVPYLEAMMSRPAGHPEGGPMHVDGAYSWFRREHPHLRTLAAIPAIGVQRSSRTDIAPLSLKDRLPVLRNLVAQARRLRNRMRR